MKEKSPEAPIRALLVGCGGMSPSWLNPIAETPGVELVGLVDLNVESAQKRAVEFGYPASYASDDMEAALAEVKPDIVFDVTVPEAHHTLT
jgi:predicted dehydrogenase